MLENKDKITDSELTKIEQTMKQKRQATYPSPKKIEVVFPREQIQSVMNKKRVFSPGNGKLELK